MWTFGNDADVSVWDVSSSSHPGHLRFLILCFRVCWDGEKRLEVHLRTYLCGIDILWSTKMKHQSISRWLSQLGLPQYCLVLEQEYDGVEVKLEKNNKKKTLHQLVDTANIYLTIPPQD